MTNDSHKWDHRMLQLASTIASWSKDPSTQVGAVITDTFHRVVSLGYNGPPRYVDDSPEVLADRDEKLRRTIHAEENALLFAHRDLFNCTAYVTHHPCARCAAKLIQAGIKRVATYPLNPAFESRWACDIVSAREMFAEAHVEFIEVFRPKE